MEDPGSDTELLLALIERAADLGTLIAGRQFGEVGVIHGVSCTAAPSWWMAWKSGSLCST